MTSVFDIDIKFTIEELLEILVDEEVCSVEPGVDIKVFFESGSLVYAPL